MFFFSRGFRAEETSGGQGKLILTVILVFFGLVVFIGSLLLKTKNQHMVVGDCFAFGTFPGGSEAREKSRSCNPPLAWKVPIKPEGC